LSYRGRCAGWRSQVTNAPSVLPFTIAAAQDAETDA